MPDRDFSNLPLDWVRAFEVAARTGGFTAAARETGLTQSAISQRIGHLERRLGARLFVRGPRGVSLTVEGEAWLPYVSAAVSSLEDSAETLFGIDRTRLVISASSSVIDLWLTPRLAAAEDGEARQITFRTMVLAAEDARGGDDIRIRYGGGDWAAAMKAPLYRERLSPVASPALAQGGDWRALPRIALSGPRAGWPDWCAMTGDPPTPVPRLRYDTFASALAAARAGLGVLCASLPLAEDDLGSGRLIRLEAQELTPQQTYWMIAPEGAMPRRRWERLVSLFTAG